MYCQQCGKKIPDDAKVCPECGKLQSDEMTEILPANTSEEPSRRDETAENDVTPHSMKQKKKTSAPQIAILGIVLGLLIVAIIWAVVVLVGRNTPNENKAASLSEGSADAADHVDSSDSVKGEETPGTAAKTTSADSTEGSVTDSTEKVEYQRDYLTDEEKQSAVQLLKEYFQINVDTMLFACGEITKDEDNTFFMNGVIGQAEKMRANDNIAKKFTALFTLKAENESKGEVILKSVSEKSFSRDTFVNAEASSVCAPVDGYTYDANNAVDGNDSTAWAEGAEGYGINETITISSASEKEVYGFAVSNGTIADDAALARNAQIKKVRVAFSDGTAKDVALSQVTTMDHGYSSCFVFDEAIKTKTISFTILDVFEGADYVNPGDNSVLPKTENTCVNEIFILE